jgi:hypothetical protein
MKITNLNNNSYDKTSVQKKDLPEKPAADPKDDVHINGEVSVKELLESDALKNLVLNVAGKLKPGEKYVFSSGGKELLAAENQGPTIGKKILESGDAVGKVLAKTIKAPVVEIGNALNEDKTSALKLAVSIAKEQPWMMPTPLVPMVDTILYPAVRVGGAVIDTCKLVSDLKDKAVSKTDKAMAALHVGTDAIGLAGEVMSLVAGGTLATVLKSVGYAGDVISLGYHGIHYVVDKGKQAGINAQGGTTPLDPPKPTPAGEKATKPEIQVNL